MKKIFFIPIALCFVLQGCRNEPGLKNVESPLVTIIKMESAEQLLEFEEAKKYVDVNKVYKDPSNDTASAEEAWKSMLIIQYNLGKTKKFTNQRKYFDYHITESVKNEEAQVIFVAKNKENTIKSTVYKLALVQGAWVVTAIEYKKSE